MCKHPHDCACSHSTETTHWLDPRLAHLQKQGAPDCDDDDGELSPFHCGLFLSFSCLCTVFVWCSRVCPLYAIVHQQMMLCVAFRFDIAKRQLEWNALLSVSLIEWVCQRDVMTAQFHFMRWLLCGNPTFLGLQWTSMHSRMPNNCGDVFGLWITISQQYEVWMFLLPRWSWVTLHSNRYYAEIWMCVSLCCVCVCLCVCLCVRACK